VLIKPVAPSVLFDTVIRMLASDPGAERHSAAAEAAGEPGLPTDRHGARVLVVEDNEINQEVAYELLTGAGLQVELAGNGIEAIAKLEAREDGFHDIVLMDMQMPLMDGLTATREIRKRLRFLELPIVAMTANVMAAEREKCLEAGMNDHVGKPIDPASLFAVLGKWIRPKSAPAETPPPARRPGAAAGPLDARLPDIEGLDSELGLARAAGRKALYLSLLRKFAAGQADAPGRLQAALAAGEKATAQRIAHTAKGLAGTIGATALQEQAEALEAAIRGAAPASEIAALLEAWGTAMQHMAAALRAALPAGEALAEPVVAAAPAEAARLLDRLEALLRENDAEAVDLIDEQAAALGAALGPDAYRCLAEVAHDFDFDRALAVLHRGAGNDGDLNESGEPPRTLAL
jgi:two-component system sensor histidine kinase/response regulator